MLEQLQNYLNKFPANATSWSQATDEVRDLCRMIREELEDQGLTIEPLNFRELRTPSDWNTKSAEYAFCYFEQLEHRRQYRIINHFEM